MDKDYTIRQATLDDISFLANAIICAEKSNTDKLSLATFFGLSEEKVRQLLVDMLEEEIEGCEFSIDSFLVVDFKGKAVAAVAGWTENFETTLPSKMLKSNLIGFIFPPESIEYVRSKSDLVTDLLIEREKDALQIEYVYTEAEHRGKRLAQQLIETHVSNYLERDLDQKKMQVQVFANNKSAIKLYERIGFSIKEEFIASKEQILNYLPHDAKLLMEKSLNINSMERNTLTEQLKEILISVLKHDDFEMRDDLTAADVDGWDSLSHAMIIMEIENHFGVKFSLREINKLSDMASLLNLIESKLATA